MTTYQCLSCFEEFEERTDLPTLRVCLECVPDVKQMEDNRCPSCGWDATSIDQDENAPVEILNRRPDWELGYCGGEHWDLPRMRYGISIRQFFCVGVAV